MTARAAAVVLVAVTIAWARPAPAQQWPASVDSIHAQLRTTLRAFYFGVAHHDWDAVSAVILPAKVVAHRPAPEALVAAARRPAGTERPSGSAPVGDASLGCSSRAALVEQAVITLDGEWAEVSVPRCAATPIGADEFRFVRFERRWWIVYIDLAREAGAP